MTLHSEQHFESLCLFAAITQVAKCACIFATSKNRTSFVGIDSKALQAPSGLDQWVASGLEVISTSSSAAAIFRMSSVIFMEQYLGPHMLQK
jgi:hypothetical protein